MTGQAISTLQHEDARLRVTLWEFPPSSETGWHRHEYDYVVVPVQGGVLTVETSESASVPYPITSGQSYARPHGVEHNISNGTDQPISFVEVELKPVTSVP